jgi:hypothetical protein
MKHVGSSPPPANPLPESDPAQTFPLSDSQQWKAMQRLGGSGPGQQEIAEVQMFTAQASNSQKSHLI